MSSLNENNSMLRTTQKYTKYDSANNTEVVVLKHWVNPKVFDAMKAGLRQAQDKLATIDAQRTERWQPFDKLRAYLLKYILLSLYNCLK